MSNNKKYFDSIAKDYDKTHVGKDSDASLRVCINAAKPFIKRPLLELGCGTGRATKIIKPNIATDFSKEMVRHTKGARVADAHKLPFKKKEFNTVISFAMLQHCEFPRKVLEEMMRVANNAIVITNIFPEYKKIEQPFLVHHFSEYFLKGLLYNFEYDIYTLPVKRGVMIIIKNNTMVNP